MTDKIRYQKKSRGKKEAAAKRGKAESERESFWAQRPFIFSDTELRFCQSAAIQSDLI